MNKKVFCLGVWDLFHEGHRAFLRKASKLGELTVGVVVDAVVTEQKGENRPVIHECERFSSVDDLKYVTKCIYLSDFIIPSDIIRTHDFIIIGEDQSHLKNLGLVPYEKKIIFPRYEGVSTSKLIKRIKRL